MNFPTGKNKVALITGSAIRVGKCIAETLHKNKYDICVHYNNSSDKAKKLVKKFNERREKSAFCIQQNLESKNSADRLFKKFIEKSQRVDLLVNNASVFYENRLNSSVDTWDSILAINLRSLYFLSVKFKNLLKNSNGCIINISDINADIPRKGYPIYSISKSGVNSLTKSLALELAPEIRVNGVAPGAIVWAENESADIRDEAILKTPLREIGHPENIADTVLFLATSNYITGQILNVDGGRSINF